MQKPIIIAFTGKAQSGKTTAKTVTAQVFSNTGKHFFIPLSFSTPLKKVYKLLTGEYFEDSAHFKYSPCEMYPHMTNREVLQWIGTDLFRKQFSADTWINALEKKMERKAEKIYREDPDLRAVVIIDDLRFPNEAHWVKANGGFVVKVERDLLSLKDAHESENQNVQADYVLKNDGDLHAFSQKLRTFLTVNVLRGVFGESEKPASVDGTIEGYVNQWLDNFHVLPKPGLTSLKNLLIYSKLVNEEINEAMQAAEMVADGRSDKELRAELLDVIWVALGAALSYGMTPEQVREGMRLLHLANSTKSCSLKEEAERYAEQNDGTVHVCKDGTFYVTKPGGKIAKGPVYKRFV